MPHRVPISPQCRMNFWATGERCVCLSVISVYAEHTVFTGSCQGQIGPMAERQPRSLHFAYRRIQSALYRNDRVFLSQPSRLPNSDANRLLQTNFSTCYRHPTRWERPTKTTNSVGAPNLGKKGRVSGTTAVSSLAGWRRLPHKDTSQLPTNF